MSLTQITTFFPNSCLEVNSWPGQSCDTFHRGGSKVQEKASFHLLFLLKCGLSLLHAPCLSGREVNNGAGREMPWQTTSCLHGFNQHEVPDSSVLSLSASQQDWQPGMCQVLCSKLQNKAVQEGICELADLQTVQQVTMYTFVYVYLLFLPGSYLDAFLTECAAAQLPRLPSFTLKWMQLLLHHLTKIKVSLNKNHRAFQ